MRSETVIYKIKFGKDELTVRLSVKKGQLLHHTWDTGYHCNADYELHVVLEGKCAVTVEDKSKSLRAELPF